MNELQRQAYVSALGIDTYMPRWLLPQAPVPVLCDFPPLPSAEVVEGDFSPPSSINPVAPVDVSQLLADMNVLKKPSASSPSLAITSAVDIAKAPPSVQLEPFSLSIWRPAEGMLVLDVRNAQLALPTELLLSNMLRAYIPDVTPRLGEELLRWPMVENRFVSRTVDDACAELQTWLAVENELRPVSCLWLMGYKAAAYFVAQDVPLETKLFQRVPLSVGGLSALYLPSLNELLQAPQQKSAVWKALSCTRE